MIVVHVEMWPKGDEKRKYHLGTAKIANDKTGTGATGNYKATLSRKGSPNSIWKTVNVKGFPRKRLLTWDLVYRVLREAIGGRNEQ